MGHIQGKIYKGIVVDILKDEDKVIVLMSDGNLHKVKPHRPYEIGEEITFKERIVTKRATNWGRVFKYASAFVAASLLLFIHNPIMSGLGNTFKTDTALATILYVESKSDIKVDVNKNQEVIKVTPLNKSAKRVINGLNWNGEEVNEFIDTYFEEMKAEGYLGAEDKAIISVVPVDESESKNALKEIKEAINENTFIKSNQIGVIAVAIPNKIVEKAESLGITPGKYSIALAASLIDEKNVPPVNVLKMVTVTELIEANPTVTQVLSNYSEDELVKLAEQQDNANFATATPTSSDTNESVTTTEDSPSLSNEAKTEADSKTKTQNSSSTTTKTTTNTTTQNNSSSTNTNTSNKTNSSSNSTKNQTETTDSTEQTRKKTDGSSTQDGSTSSSNTQKPSTGNETSASQPEEGQNTSANKSTEEPKSPSSDQQPTEPTTKPDESTESENEQTDEGRQNQENLNQQEKPNQTENKEPTVLDKIVAIVKKIRNIS